MGIGASWAGGCTIPGNGLTCYSNILSSIGMDCFTSDYFRCLDGFLYYL